MQIFSSFNSLAFANLPQQKAPEVNETFRLTKLHIAIHDNDQEEINKILERGINLEERSIGWLTALHHAVILNNRKLVKTLENGARIEAPSNYQMTALHIAAERGHLESLKELLMNGANPSARFNTGETALELAKRKEQTKVAYFLEKVWPVKSELEKQKRLRHLGEKYRPAYGNVGYLFTTGLPLTNVTKFLTFREVMEMDQEEGS